MTSPGFRATQHRSRLVAIGENGRRVGETHHRAKLTDAQIDEIRELGEERGVKAPELARRYNVTQRYVRMVLAYLYRATTTARWVPRNSEVKTGGGP